MAQASTGEERVQESVTLSGAVSGLEQVVAGLYSAVYGDIPREEEETLRPASKLLNGIDRIQDIKRQVEKVTEHLKLLE